MCLGDAEYEINGVKYIVSSRFQNLDPHNFGKTVTDRLEKYIGSDFADLNDFENDANINNEYVITTAGKED